MNDALLKDSSKTHSCIFCGIISRTIPSDIFYEDTQCIAFLDIHPHSKGHALVVPKQHREHALSMANDEVAELFSSVQTVAKKLSSVLGVSDMNIITNVGPHAGQVIFHAHVHIIPRAEGDRRSSYSYTGQEKEALLALLKQQ